jgi:hypothetical protein
MTPDPVAMQVRSRRQAGRELPLLRCRSARPVRGGPATATATGDGCRPGCPSDGPGHPFAGPRPVWVGPVPGDVLGAGLPGGQASWAVP